MGLALHVGAYFEAYFVMEKYLGSCYGNSFLESTMG